VHPHPRLLPPSKKKASETFRSVRPMLKQLVMPRRGKLALGFLLMLINVAMAMVLPYAPKIVLDNIITRKQYALLTPLVLVVFGATVIQALTSFSLTQLLSKEGQRLIAQLRRQVQEHVGRLPVAYYDAT
jgi:subfamily B ATP-binding cassette protein MsbA